MSATIERIHPTELAEIRKNRTVTLIDVRTPAEYEEVHADGAKLVPLDRLDPKALAAECANGDCIYFICRSGGRGTQAWEQAGLPVVRGRKIMSLERQVRIAAGSLVLVGAALGAFVHIGFIGLSAFVGAGLAYSGLTDTCSMGMLMSKMPWNRRSAKPACKV